MRLRFLSSILISLIVSAVASAPVSEEVHADALHWLTRMVPNRMERAHQREPPATRPASLAQVSPPAAPQAAAQETAQETAQVSSQMSSMNPVDCQLSDWSAWSICSITCGQNGTKRSQRTAILNASHGGYDCDIDRQRQALCNGSTLICPVPCGWYQWGPWTDTCGDMCVGNTSSRYRGQIPGTGIGELVAPCNPADGIQTLACPGSTIDCAHCEWSHWHDWGACQLSCGAPRGSRNRFRHMVTLQSGIGRNCTGQPKDSTPCPNLFDCPSDCHLGFWQDWSDCSVSCGTGLQNRTRPMQDQKHGGRPCCQTAPDSRRCLNIQSLSIYQPCVRPTCIFGCRVDEWGDWSHCSATLGGYRNRSRYVNGSSQCTMVNRDHQKVSCNVTASNKIQDCLYTDWSRWGSCSSDSCTRLRNRQVAQDPYNRGAGCMSETIEEIACGLPGECNTSSSLFGGLTVPDNITIIAGKTWITFPDGSMALYTVNPDGSTVATFPNGTVIFNFAGKGGAANGMSTWYSPVMGEVLGTPAPSLLPNSSAPGPEPEPSPGAAPAASPAATPAATPATS